MQRRLFIIRQKGKTMSNKIKFTCLSIRVLFAILLGMDTALAWNTPSLLQRVYIGVFIGVGLVIVYSRFSWRIDWSFETFFHLFGLLLSCMAALLILYGIVKTTNTTKQGERLILMGFQTIVVIGGWYSAIQIPKRINQIQSNNSN